MTLDPLHVATWRFEQIAPVFDYSLNRKERSNLVDMIAVRAVLWPSGQLRPIARSTLYLWIRLYRKKPDIQSLLPVKRTASNSPVPVIKAEWLQYALALIEQEPSRSLFVLCQHIRIHFNLDKPPSRSSLHRCLVMQSRYAYAKKILPHTRRTRFVAAAIHQIWHGDAKTEFTVNFTDGTSRSVRILSLLDDCSRYVLSAQIVASESIVAAVHTFWHAATRFGLPLSFYADRGSPYDSYLFRQGLAILGIRRINTKPRNPSAHGKIEAYHRCLHQWFIKELPHQQVHNIAHLQQLLDAMIDLLYHHHVHRQLKQSPHNAFNNTISARIVSLHRLHEAFLQHHALIPERKTGNVRLNGTLFLTPAEFLVPRRKLRFANDLLDHSNAYLIDSSEKLIKLLPAVHVVPLTPANNLIPDQCTGPLTPLLETYRGRTLQRAVSGFGLPEIYSVLSRALNRSIPSTELEASNILLWLKKHGPFHPAAFSLSLESVIKKIGPGRPLCSILDEISKTIIKPESHL